MKHFVCMCHHESSKLCVSVICGYYILLVISSCTSKCTRCYIAIIVFSSICFKVLCLEYLCEPSCDTCEKSSCCT